MRSMKSSSCLDHIKRLSSTQSMKSLLCLHLGRAFSIDLVHEEIVMPSPCRAIPINLVREEFVVPPSCYSQGENNAATTHVQGKDKAATTRSDATMDVDLTSATTSSYQGFAVASHGRERHCY
ncbi:hypothetical protein ACH5RR_018137 [Cinchona calisaya]|uniref:Uncharacterized protein n=1 Tax=Cinchona calisaya TaxID=153742 RepID=A0ABD2ZKZ1_9GENT